MAPILTGDKIERTWQASLGNCEATARLMERHGYPKLAREWWGKTVQARRRQGNGVRTVGERSPAGCSSLPA
jgi:hypothetical protein